MFRALFVIVLKKKINFPPSPFRRHVLSTSILIVIFRYHNFQVILSPYPPKDNNFNVFAKLLRMCLGYVSLFVCCCLVLLFYNNSLVYNLGSGVTVNGSEP